MITTFLTDQGIAVDAVTAEQMREVDRVAIAETGPNLFQMMENAGRALAQQTLELLGDGWQGARVVVLAGGGGNGGGGICAARHLANREVDVTLVLSEPAQLGDVPTWQRTVFRATRGREADLGTLGAVRPDIIVDALIGYGLREAPHGRVAELIAWANTNGARRLALDLPSGLNATSGEAPGACIRAHATLTLALPKTGLGSDMAGDLWLADLGIPRATYERAGLSYANPFGASDRVRIAPRPAPAADGKALRSEPHPDEPTR